MQISVKQTQAVIQRKYYLTISEKMEQNDEPMKLSMGEYADKTSPEVQKIKDQWMKYSIYKYKLMIKGNKWN